jgi:hypothetical protein
VCVVVDQVVVYFPVFVCLCSAAKDTAVFLGIGAIVCLHWVMFYTSIKLGTYSAAQPLCGYIHKGVF